MFLAKAEYAFYLIRYIDICYLYKNLKFYCSYKSIDSLPIIYSYIKHKLLKILNCQELTATGV